jgi:hypothetical protein
MLVCSPMRMFIFINIKKSEEIKMESGRILSPDWG